MKTNSNLVEENPFVALIGLDWGDSHHALAILDCSSGKIESRTLDHSVESVLSWLKELEQRFDSKPVALALETSKGPLIHMFLGVPWLTVFPIHPATSARLRRAFSPSGAKDDLPDAHVLLDLLNHHRAKLRPLFSDDVQTRRLGGLCELRRKSVDQRTHFTNQLSSTLKDYFPQALALIGENLYSPMALEFLKRWPDLISLKACRESTLKTFYYRHNVRSSDAVEKRLKVVREAKALTTDEAIILATTRQVARLIRLLAEIQKHIAEDEKLIREAFKQHPDAELFRDLPGAGMVLAPRLLVAFGTDRTRYESAAQLQRYSGVAPVKEKSGGRLWVHWRWNASRFLRQTFVEWACQTAHFCPWSKAYYEQQKKKGKNHWAIMRSLAFIWIRILWKCWQTRTPYNESRYLEVLRKRQSLLLAVPTLEIAKIC
jgi:transposase